LWDGISGALASRIQRSIPPSALTLDQAVANTIEPTNHRRERFDEEMIFVAGGSRGSTLGVLAVQQRPDH